MAMSFSQEMGDEELLHVLEVQECVYKQRKILATNGGSSGASTGVIQQQQTTTTTNVIPAVDSKRSGSATVVSSSASSTIRSPVTTTSTTAVAATTTATTAAGVGTAGRENMPKYNQQGGAMFSPPAKQLVPVTPSTASPSMSFMSPMVGDKRSAEMMAMTPLSSAAYTPTSHQQGGGGGGGGVGTPGGFMSALAEMNGPSYEEREAARHRQQQLVEDLERQVQEKRDRKAKELARERQLIEKEEKEAMEYNPWGRPGAGAPNKNGHPHEGPAAPPPHPPPQHQQQPPPPQVQAQVQQQRQRQQQQRQEQEQRREVTGRNYEGVAEYHQQQQQQVQRRQQQQQARYNDTFMEPTATYGRDPAPLPEGGVMVAVPKARPPRVVDPYEAEVQQALRNEKRRQMGGGGGGGGGETGPRRPSVHELRSRNDVDSLAEFCQQLEKENHLMRQRLERQEKAFAALARRQEGDSGEQQGHPTMGGDYTALQPYDRHRAPAVTGGFVLRTPPQREGRAEFEQNEKGQQPRRGGAKAVNIQVSPRRGGGGAAVKRQSSAMNLQQSKKQGKGKSPARPNVDPHDLDARAAGRALDASTRFIFLDKTTDYHPLSAPFELSGFAAEENSDSGVIATKTYL
uniref:Uncharacterized protein n=1 Tax=Palpitomonas bilix TaxID=652834 RepID=A0A7S3DFW8_9EUKA|mmetsp:Transcript_35347/g.91903  ORF Transcript_35347/g.91903 Transcript_35347/m.91903 type:complete len:628 (+) Transcript_35347:280-2163(+)